MVACDTTYFITWLCTCPAPQGFAQWLIAIGTIGAVIFATCAPLIRNRWNRPKISFSFDKNPLYVVEKSEGVESANDDKIVEIRFGLKNVGRSSTGAAASSEIQVDSYYKERKESYVMEDNFPAICLKDLNGKLPTLVPQKIIYVPIAVIKNRAKPNVEAKESQQDAHDKKHDYNLYFKGKEDILLGRGKFIIPIQYISPKIAETGYLKLYWDSEELDLTEKKFAVEFISEKQFVSSSQGSD